MLYQGQERREVGQRVIHLHDGAHFTFGECATVIGGMSESTARRLYHEEKAIQEIEQLEFDNLPWYKKITKIIQNKFK